MSTTYKQVESWYIYQSRATYFSRIIQRSVCFSLARQICVLSMFENKKMPEDMHLQETIMPLNDVMISSPHAAEHCFVSWRESNVLHTIFHISFSRIIPSFWNSNISQGSSSHVSNSYFHYDIFLWWVSGTLLILNLIYQQKTEQSAAGLSVLEISPG